MGGSRLCRPRGLIVDSLSVFPASKRLDLAQPGQLSAVAQSIGLTAGPARHGAVRLAGAGPLIEYRIKPEWGGPQELTALGCLDAPAILPRGCGAHVSIMYPLDGDTGPFFMDCGVARDGWYR